MSASRKELMVHVERIVRPIRATMARKLRMRRELLAHLEAAVEEERERGSEEAAALAAGMRRLGDAGELRRSLQESVPKIERILLMRSPTTAWMDRWGEKNNRELGLEGMTLGPSLIGAVGATVLSYGGIAAQAFYFGMTYREALQRTLGNQTGAMRVGALVVTAATLATGLLALHVMGRAARGERRGWKGAALAGVVVGLSMVWMAAALLGVGEAIVWPPMAVSAAAGVGMLASLVALGKWMRGVPRPHTEWLQLQIAE